MKVALKKEIEAQVLCLKEGCVAFKRILSLNILYLETSGVRRGG
jgi:hypothetical protein